MAKSQAIACQFNLLIALFLSILLGFTPPASALSFTSGSGLTGLMELKQIAKQSTPYEVAMHNAKPTLIEFYADWCVTCRAMAPTMHQLYQAKANEINFVMLNIDNPQWITQLKNYQVTGVPQFTVLSATGELQNTFYGRVPQSVLAETLQMVIR